MKANQRFTPNVHSPISTGSEMPMPAERAKVGFPRPFRSKESGRIERIALRAEASLADTHSLSLLAGGFFHGFRGPHPAATYRTAPVSFCAHGLLMQQVANCARGAPAVNSTRARNIELNLCGHRNRAQSVAQNPQYSASADESAGGPRERHRQLCELALRLRESDRSPREVRSRQRPNARISHRLRALHAGLFCHSN